MVGASILIACVVVLSASFIITLIEGTLMQANDFELDAMALYLVSIASLIVAKEVWKRTNTVLSNMR